MKSNKSCVTRLLTNLLVHACSNKDTHNILTNGGIQKSKQERAENTKGKNLFTKKNSLKSWLIYYDENSLLLDCVRSLACFCFILRRNTIKLLSLLLVYMFHSSAKLEEEFQGERRNWGWKKVKSFSFFFTATAAAASFTLSFALWDNFPFFLFLSSLCQFAFIALVLIVSQGCWKKDTASERKMEKIWKGKVFFPHSYGKSEERDIDSKHKICFITFKLIHT